MEIQNTFTIMITISIRQNLQQLVTAKLLATSRLSMCGVSLKSAIPNWTIPTRNALYSWSAPLGNRPPAGGGWNSSQGQEQDRKGTLYFPLRLLFLLMFKTRNIVLFLLQDTSLTLIVNRLVWVFIINSRKTTTTTSTQLKGKLCMKMVYWINERLSLLGHI